MWYWADDLMDYLLIVLLSLCAVLALLVVIGASFSIVGQGRAHDRFMEQCQEDHKEYECVAMWRGGKP